MSTCPLCRVCPALSLLALVAVPAALLLAAAPIAPQDGGTKKEWGVHDKDRPQPAMVTPAGHGTAPSDAISLFDGKSLDAWTGGAGTAAWEVKKDERGEPYFQVKAGSGNIRTLC